MTGDPASPGGAGCPRGQSIPGTISDVLLRRLADLLSARGMEIHKHEHGGEIVEVVVLNPRDPERGRAVIGYDGLVIWEYRTELKIDSDVESNAEAICALLIGRFTSQRGHGGCLPQRRGLFCE